MPFPLAAGGLHVGSERRASTLCCSRHGHVWRDRGSTGLYTTRGWKLHIGRRCAGYIPLGGIVGHHMLAPACAPMSRAAQVSPVGQ